MKRRSGGCLKRRRRAVSPGKGFVGMGYYDYYKEDSHNSYGSGWGYLWDGIRGADVGIWRIMMNVAVFSAGIALLAAILLLALSVIGGTSSKTFQEAKKWIVRIIIISVLIFASSGLITLVGTMGLD